MRIGIDARMYGSRRQGLGRYVEELIRGLSNIDSANEYVIFTLNKTDLGRLPSRTRVVHVPFKWYGWLEQLVWPFVIMRQRLDLMHFPHFNVPLLYRGVYIITIHDLILLHHHGTHASLLHPLYYKFKFLLYRLVLNNAVKKAAHIITVSHFSRQDIVRHFPHAGKKVSVIYLGADFRRHSDSLEKMREFAPIRRRYIVYVGNAYPHKNLDFLLKHFLQYAKIAGELSLVLVGARDFFYQRLERSIAPSDRVRVIFMDSVSDETLSGIYRHAAAYVFPSLYEGFGVPPLEAMSFGIPVLASRATSLPEILGDAALFFDPHDGVDFTSKLHAILTNDEIRRKLTGLGKDRSLKYKWSDTALQTYMLYLNIRS